MKQVLLLLLLLCAVASLVVVDAWVPSKVINSVPRVDVALNASRRRVKKQRQTEWLRKRGYDYDGYPLKKDTITIVGSGRIGGLLAEKGENTVVGRQDTIDANGSGPIFLTTRNDALDGIVDKCPQNRRKDLVFMQNGYLDDFLRSRDLMGNTQALLYLSVTAKGAEPIDGATAVNPEGLTAVTGEHAQALADRLSALNLKCKVVTPEEYRPAMFEKLIWISTYMLVGTAKECKSVGEAGSEHKELVEQVINELVAAVTDKEGIAFPDGVLERLAAYTDVVTDFPCAVKEFVWRNEYFYNLGDEACPTHNGLLRECREKEFVDFDLP